MQYLFKILKKVSNPAQYINSEWNIPKIDILSKWNKKETLKICLCLPEKYTISMSNLGIIILYKLLNSLENVLCERAFVVDTDMEKILISEKIFMFSLETQHPLKDFDIIGFSLQDELNYVNIFTVLYLSGIPFEREKRKEIFPLIVAGGPCASNPYVLENFIDFFILGEAEESIINVVNIILECKKEKLNKLEILKRIDILKETYVPGISSKTKQIYPAVVDINKSFYPKDPVVPLIRVAHSRLNIELTRGCSHSCNFCRASYTSKPLRFRNKEYVFSLIEESIKTTGYDEIAFTGFTVTDYPYLLDVIEFVHKKFSNKCISISLPSLKVEDVNEKLIKGLSLVRKPTITLAIEAATERLRKILNKKVSNEEIFNKIKLLYRYGFKKIKLYFIIGLPTETEKEVEEIPAFVKKLKKYFPGLRINLTISIFMPKPHTPFQFAKMDDYESLYKKILFLKKNLKGIVNFGNIEKYIWSSYIEALISQGDSTIGKFLKTVWEKGARFPNWEENFDLNIWKENLKDVDMEKLIFKEKDFSCNFVWDNIKYNFSKESLYKKYTEAINYKETSDSFVVDKEEINITSNFESDSNEAKETSRNLFRYSSLYTLRLKFGRRGKLKFISYLDEVEIFKKILRLSQIPVCFTCGYNPQIKFSLGLATPVGYESNSEYLDVEIYEILDKKEIFKRITNFLPEGLFLIDCKIFDLPLNKIPSLNNNVNLIEYIVEYPLKFSQEKLENFYNSDKFIVEKKKNNTIQILNLHEIVKEIKLINDTMLLLILKFSPEKNLRPEVVVGNIFGINTNGYYELEILRNELYKETDNGNFIGFL